MTKSELKKEIKRLDTQIEELESSARESVKSVQENTQWMRPSCKIIKSNPVPWVLGAVVAGVVFTKTVQKRSKRTVSTTKARDVSLIGLLSVELKRWAAKEAVSYVRSLASKRSLKKSS
ncbi:MAG: hypothetical protein RI513_02670 [Balneolaceae bacterium]|nr:hypothetical protein [Balneolaceae bacterium]MDR9446293.1 hypothetical protein [Balneolaceae bacterium]